VVHEGYASPDLEPGQVDLRRPAEVRLELEEGLLDGLGPGTAGDFSPLTGDLSGPLRGARGNEAGDLGSVGLHGVLLSCGVSGNFWLREKRPLLPGYTEGFSAPVTQEGPRSPSQTLTPSWTSSSSWAPAPAPAPTSWTSCPSSWASRPRRRPARCRGLRPRRPCRTSTRPRACPRRRRTHHRRPSARRSGRPRHPDSPW